MTSNQHTTTSELQALLDAASPLPWRTLPDADGAVWAREGYGMAATGCGEGNAALIVAAVNALPDLLARMAHDDALRDERNHWIGEAKRYERLYRRASLRSLKYFSERNEARAERDQALAAVKRVEALADEWDACDEAGFPLREGSFGEAADDSAALSADPTPTEGADQ